MRLAVTTTTALAAIMALAPTVFAAPGATVENFCNFPISFYGDFGGSTVADVVSGTIDPGMTYYENYNPHAGRALHFWPTGQSASVLLVFGYTVDSSTPFVWTGLDDVNGDPFDGSNVQLTGTGGSGFNCNGVDWPAGEPGSKEVMACDKTYGLILTFCGDLAIGH